MTHYRLLMVSGNEEDVALDGGNKPDGLVGVAKKRMSPYWDLDLTFEEAVKDPRAVFVKEDEVTVEALEKKWKEWNDHGRKDFWKHCHDKHVQLWEGHLGSKFMHDMDGGTFTRGDMEKTASEEADRYAKDCKTLEEFAWFEDRLILSPDRRSLGHLRNPKEKFDLFEIGGRYSGMLRTKQGSKGIVRGINKKLEYVFAVGTGNVDSALVKDINPRCIKSMPFFAIITIDGEWVDRKDVKFFGLDDKTWESECYPRFVENLPGDARLTVIDYHV